MEELPAQGERGASSVEEHQPGKQTSRSGILEGQAAGEEESHTEAELEVVVVVGERSGTK